MLEKHPLGQAVEVELELHHPDRTTGALVGDRKAYGSAIGINSTKMKQHPSRLSTAICGTTETPVLAAAMRFRAALHRQAAEPAGDPHASSGPDARLSKTQSAAGAVFVSRIEAGEDCAISISLTASAAICASPISGAVWGSHPGTMKEMKEQE
jgi:hypothetical protein